MRRLIMTGLAVVMLIMAAMGNVICSGESDPVRVSAPESTVNRILTVYAAPWVGVGEYVRFEVDGACLFSTTNQTETAWIWQPQTLGNHTLTCTLGPNVFEKTVNVAALDFFVQPAPNPPMAKDPNISIYPDTDYFDVGGGGLAISTSGSGTWTAVASEPWITLNSTNGEAGKPLAFRVSANTNVEERTAYIYVSGHIYTATQAGVGANVDKNNISVEYQGGNGTVNVIAQNRIAWQARPHIDWISVSPTSGSGEGSVTYQVAPYDEVSTRQGTITIAGNMVSVFQYGRRMKLATYEEKRDWYSHVIPITVNALAITEWNVMPNASWISVVDGGNGRGGDLVSIAISENPSYKERIGTVTIGTEVFTVIQEGRTDLAISINPIEAEASVNGANALLSIYATPDLPWTVTSDSSWVVIYDKFKNGAGNGNVVYSVTPNSTLYDRVAVVSVTPEAASGMPVRKHTVRQPAAESAISLNGYEFEAAGETCSVEVSVADIVEWKVEDLPDWVTVNGSVTRMGSGTVVLQAVANNTVYPRSAVITIARKTFTIMQKARGVEVEYEEKLFNARGGYTSVSIHPDGDVAWTVEVSDDWIIVWGDESGTGDAEIEYMVAAWNDVGNSRTGWIKIGDKKIYITQRAYDLSISPNGKNVTGNNGAGEFGVSASIGDVWNAIVTEPWITIIDGYDAGIGSGTVRFIYTENNTGKTRTGKIIVAGEVYTIEQAARTMVSVTATAGRGGKVSGGGSYDLGTEVTLTAVPDDGYAFSYWTGDVDSMQNPITVTADVAKSLTAVFEPLPIVLDSVTSGTDGVRLSWNNLAWASVYRIYRGVRSVPSSATVLAEIVNTGNCTYLDESGVVGTTYWYWIEAEGAEDSVMSDPMTGMKQKPIVISPITYGNLRGATHTNPETYQEGTLVSFTNPSGVTGYTFAGWMPSQITTDMTGAQTVNASWTANSYSISYNANGGSGTMDATSATYDTEAIVSANGFTYAGHVFKGWATGVDGEVVYAAGQPVTNLTAQSSGVVTLYAVWGELVVPAPVVTPPDGTVFTEGSREVTITCPMEGATIYYSTSGSAPRPTNAFEYSGAFSISDTTKIIAFARKDNVNSATVILTITKRSLSLAEAAGDANLVFTTGGDANWTPMGDNTAATGFSAQSGAISDEGCTWMKTTVSGVGTLTFQWKVDCESDYITGEATWDHLRVETEGGEIARIDGTIGWIAQTIVFDKPGEHTICWTFDKDDYNGEEYPDRAWVSGVTWAPATVQEPIPEVTKDSEVSAALKGSTDAKLVANITTAAEYAMYRTWAMRLSGATAAEVKASPNAWLSYALGCESLIATAPVAGDVVIDSFESSSTDGAFEFTVKLKDIAVGYGALEDNLKKVFDIEGREKLSSGEFSSNAVQINAAQADNGNVKFTVTPKVEKDEKPTSFFFKVKMK